MATLTVHIDDMIKNNAQKNTKKDGITLTFLVNQFLKAYNNGELQFRIAQEDIRYQELSERFQRLAKRKIHKASLPPLRDQLADV